MRAGGAPLRRWRYGFALAVLSAECVAAPPRRIVWLLMLLWLRRRATSAHRSRRRLMSDNMRVREFDGFNSHFFYFICRVPAEPGSADRGAADILISGLLRPMTPFYFYAARLLIWR